MSAAERSQPKPGLGFVGVGAMGGPMASNLLRAGYDVLAFDLSEERLRDVESVGVRRAGDASAVVRNSEIVLVSLPSSDAFVSMAESILLPHARPGQAFIDFGTTTPPETRRLAAAFAARGASLVDAPVSGGVAGAERAALLTFVGGDPEVVERCRPLLEAVGGADRLTYCGPSGAGQIVKGVNQLAMGLGAAAYLEAVAFGVLAGVDAETIGKAVGGAEPWRVMAARTAERIAAGTGDEIGVKFRELPYFLQEASERGFPLPLTELLYNLCDAGERVVIDDNRPAPSYWHRLRSLAAADEGKQEPQ